MAIRMSGLNSGLDTEAIVKELMKAEDQKVTNIKNKQTKLEWKTDKWKDLNTKISTFYTGKLSNARFESTFNAKKANVADSTVATVTAQSGAVNGTHSLAVKQLAQAKSYTSWQYKDITGSSKLTDVKDTSTGKSLFRAGQTFTISCYKDGKIEQVEENGTKRDKTVSFTIGADDTVNTMITKMQEAGVNASFDSTEHRFYFSSKSSGAENYYKMTSSDGTAIEDILGGSTIDGKDAVFYLDGTEYTKSSNTNSINGLDITLTGTTKDYDLLSTRVSTAITVTSDTDAAYKNVKELLKEFNEVLTAVYDAYNADDADDYDILTDDQKEEMSDDEEKEWNDKIKSALLRRDDNAKDVLSHLQNDLTGAVVTVNGKKFSLSSFGISSVVYTEHGKLHIDGDSDDELTSGNEDKLKKALTEDPDTTAKALSQLFSKLYGSTKKGERTGLSAIAYESNDYKSAQKFYNDKQYTKLAADYKTELRKMQEKVSAVEERYYDQFTQMEKALSTINSQTSSLSGLIGS
jgi:flagellar hook-associated protein 2